MKKYNIKVNGISYEVEVEEAGSGASEVKQAAAAPVAAAVPSAPKPAAAGGKTIKAPMPGTVLKLNVKAGAAVKKGETLIVLEAMKMENDITAPEDGVIASVNVAQGAAVNTGDTLVTFN